jgi:GNAT superfamily N-acetyltransferase
VRLEYSVARVQCSVIGYQSNLNGISAAQLEGFFVGWPNPPSMDTHLRILEGSAYVVLALEGDRVIGFVSAISDGVLSAYISLLEVLPNHQGRGRGTRIGEAREDVARGAVHD